MTPGWGIKVDLEVDDFKHNWTALNSFLIAFKVGEFGQKCFSKVIKVPIKT